MKSQRSIVTGWKDKAIIKTLFQKFASFRENYFAKESKTYSFFSMKGKQINCEIFGKTKIFAQLENLENLDKAKIGRAEIQKVQIF